MLRLVGSVALLALAIGCGGDDDGDGGDNGDGTGQVDGGGGGGIDSGGDAVTCASYCETLQANCTGANAQFSTMQNCVDSCAGFPAGAAGDQSGNSLACRAYHADAAEGDPGLHCAHAGPGGAGVCGSNCEGYCSIALEACDVYADEAACMTECGGFADEEPYDAGDTSGDSLACRLYHLTAASTQPEPHCGHIEADSPTCQ